MPGSTRSGGVFESLIVPILVKNGYLHTTQQIIGTSVSGKRHRVDALISLQTGQKVPISLKWQEVSGTAEEKVPYEVIKLIHSVVTSEGLFPYAYLVLGGEGWSSVKQFYLNGGLKTYIKNHELVHIISLDSFITRANRKNL